MNPRTTPRRKDAKRNFSGLNIFLITSVQTINLCRTWSLVLLCAKSAMEFRTMPLSLIALFEKRYGVLELEVGFSEVGL
jgi:hypothetical protein